MAKREGEYQRLELLYQMLLHYLEQPYSDNEMGEELNTDRTNVWRIRKLMGDANGGLGIPLQESVELPGKYFIRKDYQMRYIHFSPQEMAALYLGARRLQQQTKTSQTHVELALRKLANAMRKPFAEGLTRAAGEVQAQEQDVQQEQTFAQLVQSWLDQTPVRIYHTKLHGVRRDYVVHPYHIEPSMWDDGNYLIGYSEYHAKIARFKIARIDKVVVSGGKFREATDFDVHHFLQYAWGIWSTDEEPVTVRLRFSKWAIPRLTETVWPNATLADPAADGSRIWEMPVAEWREMVPWVRSWGSDVEVLEPVEMREAIEKEVKRLVRLYNVVELPAPPLFQQLWAKTSKDRIQTHPLICHLLDVAQVALSLWNNVLTASARTHFADALGLATEEAGRTIAFWIGLHDLGKACPGFQRLYPPAIEQLTTAGLTFAEILVKDRCYHATLTTCTLDILLMEETGLSRSSARRIAQALGGHHGTWPPSAEVEAVKQHQIGDANWQQVRRELVCVLRDLLKPAAVTRLGQERVHENTFLTLFSGLTTTADWIGSMEEFFPYVDAPIEPSTYFTEAGQQALNALQQLNWTGWQPPQSPITFAQLFPFPPNSVQREAIKLAPQLKGPALVIVEVTTGSGKTETALYLADYQAATRQQRGMYIAMPTMATSNQMFSRTSTFLQKRYPLQAISPLLVHSQARWMQEPALPDLTVNEEVGNEEGDASVRDMSWFLPRKRSLLAPFGVGTVDQTLLSVLQTRHFFVRLFALSHKTIIFDEVHAYDIYMSELFQQLLRWLRMVGATVIILSATLPAATRRRLVAAYLGDDEIALPDAPYPALTWATADRNGVIPLEATEARPPIALHWIDRNPQTIVDELAQTLSDGGCAAIICNTIARAQAIYRALAEANLVPPDDLILFHARNPFAWRDEIEKVVLARFGKDGKKDGTRPQKSIVVATQVIEQSLDLDFDLMISDLAPVDLLIQRAGRLHRHDHNNRPAQLAAPILYVTVDREDGTPSFENDVYIYEPYILLKTYLALQGHPQLILPQQTSALIEAVYNEEYDIGTVPAAFTEEVERAHSIMAQNQEKARLEAKTRLILKPDDEDLLSRRSPGLEEDSPELHASFQALTRLGDRSLAVVCLHQLADGLNTEPDGSGTYIDLSHKPNAYTTRVLAHYSVNISSKPIVYHLLKQGEIPPTWRDHALLRDHFVLIFADGQKHLPEIKTTLRLGHEYGLEILKEES